jgi:ABC-type tungstate transport system substrate-binding protein
MKHLGIGFASFFLGFILLFPLGWLFDRMDWPLFHSWGLIHGSFLLAIPLLMALSFGTIEAVAFLFQRGKRRGES